MPNKNTVFQRLLRKEENIVSLKNFLSAVEAANFKRQLLQSFEGNPNKFQLPDGYFYPFPYSAVHKAIPDSEQSYFQFADSFYQAHQALIISLKKALENHIGDPIIPLEYKTKNLFSHFNTRILYHGKNGIDIHCENAFLHQLEDDFKEFMLSEIDLENSISFFVVLQKPSSGGELILFDKEWDDISIDLGTTTIEERNDLGGSIFKNRGVGTVCHKYISLEEGDAVLFRAAQIWHTINKVDGDTDRITIGCFLAQGHDGKNYFWA